LSRIQEKHKAALRNHYYLYIVNKTNEEHKPFSAHPIMQSFANKWTYAPMPLLGYSMSKEQWSGGKDNEYERSR